MPPAFTTFIGVDSGTWRRPFTYIALDANRKLLAVGSGSPADVLAYACGQSAALLAFSQPLRPYPFHPSAPENGLTAVGGFLQRSAAPRQPPEGLPHWLRAAYSVLARLDEFGYRPYPQEEAALQWLEVHSEAAFHAVLGLAPFAAGTLEGRIQRQLALADFGLDVPDAMEFFEEITRHRLLRGILPWEQVLPQGELNAWMAAGLAWQAAVEPGALAPVQAGQGMLYLPVRQE